MNPEKREAVQKALDDTMTVSQAKQRKLDLRAKELELRQATLDRKRDNDAKAEKRRQERDQQQEKNRQERAAAKEAAAKEAKDKQGTSAAINAKRRRDELEKKKLEKVKGIADKRKAGVQKSMDRARQVAPKMNNTITKDQGEGQALMGLAGNVTNAAVGTARVGFNLGKAGVKAVASAPARMKAANLQKKADAKQKKIDDRNQKLADARAKRVQDRLQRRQEYRKSMKEEFLSEVEEKTSKEKKTDKVIDIMRGKNKIEVSPKISEEVTGGILVQDLKDYKPLEIETVDVVKAQPLQEYSALVRQGIKVGGKKGGRAVQAGEKAAIAKGRQAQTAAKQGNQKKMVGDGKAEKIGAVVGGVAGGVAGGLLDGPLPVGDIVGGIGGSKVGGKIGRQVDKMRAKKKEVSEAAPKYDKKGLDKYDRSKRMIRHKQDKYGVATFKQSLMHGADHNIDNEKKAKLKEEESDRLKDRRMERGGVGGNQRYDKAPKAPNTKKFGSGKTALQKEMEKKHGKGKSAMDIVRAEIEKKHGKGAIMKTKKEHYDWRTEYLDEFVGTTLAGTVGAATAKPKDRVRKAIGSGAGYAVGSTVGKNVGKTVGRAMDPTSKIPLIGGKVGEIVGSKVGSVAGGVVGSVAGNKLAGETKEKKKKPTNEHSDWRSDLFDTI